MSTGGFTITGTGGVSPFTYSLNTISNSTGIFSGLSSGNYLVTITDSHNCSIDTNITILEPALLDLNVNSIIHPTCFGLNNGQVSCSAIGGTGPYQFSILNSQNLTGIFTGLSNGIYTVSLTDINSCTAFEVFTLTSPSQIVIDSIQLVQPLCFGLNDGSISISSSGGSGNLAYSLNGQSFNQGSTQVQLSANNYIVTIMDQNGCFIDTNVVLGQPSILSASMMLSQNVTCNGSNNGILNIVASGGTPQYNFELLSFGLVNNSGLFTGVGPGTYTIMITDDKACTTQIVHTISEPLPLNFVSIIKNDVLCFNQSNGSIQVTGAGGTLNYSFLLNPGSLLSLNGIYNGLGGGNYTLNLTDANGCTIDTNITISTPAAILIDSIVKKDILCYGDSTGVIQVFAQGGVGQLNYILQGNTNTNNTFTNLLAGNYIIAIVDANNCSVSTVVSLIENPPIVLDSVSLISPLCKGQSNGSIYIIASGGVGTLDYYFNGQQFIDFISLNNINAGSYQLQIQDVHNCTLDSLIQLNEPDFISSNVSILSGNYCEGNKDGIVATGVIGGTKPYVVFITPNFLLTNNDTIQNLGSGTYTMTVRDANNCIYVTTFIVPLQALPFEMEIFTDSITCLGFGIDGMISVDANGGFSPYQYSLNNGDFSEFHQWDSLKWGTYTITVKDEKGCSLSDSVTLNAAPCCEIYWPNAFSPNNDQINDLYKPITSAGYQIKQYQIFDRWGNKVFDSFDPQIYWDGTYKGLPLDQDTYYLIFSYKCLFNNDVYTLKRDINLFR
jgi:gliding motility-associated-like protein